MKHISAINKGQPQGWHPADIVAQLRKRGWSLRRLSTHHGYAPTVLSTALRLPWPKGEALVAEAAGVPAQELWPDRYGPDGKPNRRPGPKPGGKGIPTLKNTKISGKCNKEVDIGEGR